MMRPGITLEYSITASKKRFSHPKLKQIKRIAIAAISIAAGYRYLRVTLIVAVTTMARAARAINRLIFIDLSPLYLTSISSSGTVLAAYIVTVPDGDEPTMKSPLPFDDYSPAVFFIEIFNWIL